MKKLLLKTSLIMLGMQSIHAQVLEKKHFALESRWNNETSMFDTTSVTHEMIKYNNDSLIFEFKLKKMEYKGKNIFDQEDYTEAFSKNGIKVNSEELILSQIDSVNLFLPNSNGSLNWVKSVWSKTNFNGNIATKTTSYADFSEFGLGIIATEEKEYSNPSKNLYVIKSYALFPERSIKDSTLIYTNGKQDTLRIDYSLDENEENLIETERTVYKYNAQGQEIETIYYTLTSGVGLTLDSRRTHQYGNNLKIETRYEGMNTPVSLDSSFYNGFFSKLSKEYDYDGKKWVLNKKTEYLDDLKFKEGSPIPLAPTELVISKPKQAIKSEQILALESYVLTWKDNSYNETGFEVYRKLSTESNDLFKLIMKLEANVTSFTDNTANSGLVYDYYVVANNNKFSSAPSNTKSSNITSINQIADKEGNTYIFPNPTKDIWNINGLGEITKIEVINNQGTVVAEQNTGNVVDVNNLNQGVYMIKVQTRNGQINYFKASKE